MCGEAAAAARLEECLPGPWIGIPCYSPCSPFATPPPCFSPLPKGPDQVPHRSTVLSGTDHCNPCIPLTCSQFSLCQSACDAMLFSWRRGEQGLCLWPWEGRHYPKSSSFMVSTPMLLHIWCPKSNLYTPALRKPYFWWDWGCRIALAVLGGSVVILAVAWKFLREGRVCNDFISLRCFAYCCQLVVVDVTSWVKVRCCWGAVISHMSMEWTKCGIHVKLHQVGCAHRCRTATFVLCDCNDSLCFFKSVDLSWNYAPATGGVGTVLTGCNGGDKFSLQYGSFAEHDEGNFYEWRARWQVTESLWGSTILCISLLRLVWWRQMAGNVVIVTPFTAHRCWNQNGILAYMMVKLEEE